MAIRRRVRWLVRHGLIRRTVNRQMRTGDLGARLMMDPALREDPYPYYDELRARGPIVPSGISLISAHHDVCRDVLRSPDFGQMRMDRIPGPIGWAVRFGGRQALGPAEPPSMLVTDPPEHTRYRRLVARAFNARAVAALRSRVERIAEELLDEMHQRPGAAGTTVDLVASYASLLPATVIAEMLGAPVAMRRQFLAWGAGASLSLDAGLGYRDFRRSEEDLTALHRWMLGQFAEIRRSPREGILSSLVASHDEGGLSTDELSSIAMLLLAAGFETTVNLLGNGVVLLLRHRDQLDLLRARPQLWPNAVEEILRYDSPVQRTMRVALRDTEMAGRRVRAGRPIVLLLGGANRDPAVFPDPGRFDVERGEAREHLSFSSGIHYCVGAALARVEGEIGLRALLRRFPDLAPAGAPHRRPTRVLRGYDAIPVRLGSRATVPG